MKKNSKSRHSKKVSNASTLIKQPLQDKAIDFIKGGNIEALSKMAEEGSDEIKFLNKFHSKTGKTSICVACEEGQIEAVQILLEAKAAVDLVDKVGMTPVLYAAKEGDNPILELLQRAKADFNACTAEHKETALMLATKFNKIKTVQLLNEYGADIDAVNDKEETAMSMAIKLELYHIADYLQQRGAKINSVGVNGNTALIRSAFDGREATAKYLLDHGADVHVRNSCSGETALMVAAKHGHAAIVTMLLQHGANINDCDVSGRTALLLCCMTGKFDMVRLLLLFEGGDKAVVDEVVVDSTDGSSVDAAVSVDPSTTATAVAADVATTDAIAATTISIATAEESKVAAAAVTRSNFSGKGITTEDVAAVAADPNILDAWGYSALIHLCTSRPSAAKVEDQLPPVLSLLLEKGAFIDQMDKNYTTALMHCCSKGGIFLPVALLLLQHDAIHDCTNIHNVAAVDLIRDEEEKALFIEATEQLPSHSLAEQYSRPGIKRKPDWVNILNKVNV